MNCGEAIQVDDLYGTMLCRFVAQCGGQFLLISNAMPGRRPYNGYLYADWRAVLRELIALAVPDRLTEAVHRARGCAGGMYHDLPLTYPLSVKGLAGLLDVEPADVKAELDDLAVQAET